MPTANDIEQFNLDLIAVADELRRSAAWGEKLVAFEELQSLPFLTVENSEDIADLDSGSNIAQSPDIKEPPAGEQKVKTEIDKIYDTIGEDDIALDALPEDTTADISQTDSIDSGDSAGSVDSIDSGDSIDSIDSADSIDGTPAEEEYSVDISDQKLDASLSLLPQELQHKIDHILGDESIDRGMVNLLIDQLILGEDKESLRSTIKQIEALTGKKVRGRRSVIASLNIRKSSYEWLRPVVVMASAFLLIFVAWRLVYRPISSALLFARGLQSIEDGNYDQADVLFTRSRRAHQFKNNHLRYARHFRQFDATDNAVAYYQAFTRAYPDDIDGAVEFAQFDALELGNFQRAVATLDPFLVKRRPNREILESIGDINLLWGDEGNTDRYEQARYHYGLTVDIYGPDAQILSRLLRYYIRVPGEEQIERLHPFLIEGNNRGAAHRSRALIELLGYYIDNNDLTSAAMIVNHPLLSNITDAEYYYHAARYYQADRNPLAFNEALDNFSLIFQRTPAMYRREKRIEILGYRLIAEQNIQQQQFTEALAWYDRAIARYQQGLDDGIFSRRAEFGSLFAGQGDVYYYGATSDEQALASYLVAQQHQYNDRGMRYRMANILYRRGEYNRALSLLNGIVDGGVEPNTLLALANTLYFVGGYGAAVGYYNELINLLEIERSVIESVDLRAQQHRAIIEMLVASYNNAGVGYARLYERQNVSSYLQQSAAYLTTANELQFLYRAQNTDIVADASIPFNNSNALFNNRSAEMVIYPAIARDTTAPADDLVTSPSVATPSDPRLRRIVFP